MHVREALERLDQIPTLTRSEVYRGFRVPAVAAVGVLGLTAAALQPFVPAVGFVWYWTAIAGVCALLHGRALHAYTYREDEFDRRRTRRVMAQFLPASSRRRGHGGNRPCRNSCRSFPGWAVPFGLGSSRRDRTCQRQSDWWIRYVVAGARCSCDDPTTEPSPWAVGGVFVGHLATARAVAGRTARGGESHG